MKTKIFTGILVSFLVISVIAIGLVTAKGEKPANAGRPEKLEQVIFVHPAEPPKGPPEGKGKPQPPEPVNNYYELLGWHLDGTLEYRVNPNGSRVSAEEAAAAVQAAAEAWDDVTTAFDGTGGLFTYGGSTENTWYELNGENTVSWVKFIPRKNIAVASVWYNPETMIIHEVDIVFNTMHKWGIDPVKEDEDRIKALDIQNIATHEFGHPTGLDDLYLPEYRELTMYGYSSKGETQKCSLEEGDIAGAQSLYGAP